MTEKRYSLFFKKKVLEMAATAGLRKTEKVFGVTRKTISSWLNRFRESGEDGLKNCSRKEQFHPRKLSDTDTLKILELKASEPKITAREIISRLNLQCSIRTVQHKIKSAVIPITIVKYDLIFHLQVEKLRNPASEKLPGYIIKMKECNSGMLFCSFCYENNSINIGIFISNILFRFNRNNLKVLIETGRGRFEYSNSKKSGRFSYFEEIVNKFKNVSVEKSAVQKSCFVFNLQQRDYEDNSHFLNEVFLYLLTLNSKIQQNDQNLFKTIFSPFITDSFIRDADKIKQDISYWAAASEQSLNGEAEHLDKLFASAKQQWQLFCTEKATDLLNTVIFYSRDNKNHELLFIKAILLLSRIKLITGYNSQSELLLKIAKEHLALHHDPRTKIVYQIYMAKYLFKIGESGKADDIYHQVLKSKRELSTTDIVDIYGNMAMIYRKIGNQKLAERFNTKACKIASEGKDFRLYGTAVSRAGIFYSSQGNYQKALDCFNQALAIGLKTNNSEELCNIYYNFGSLNYSKGLFKNADNYLNQALNQSLLIDNKEVLARTLSELSLTKSALQNYDEAEIHFKKAKDIALAIGHKLLITQTMRAGAIIYWRKKQTAKSIYYYEKTLKLDQEINDKENYITDLGNLSLAYLQQNNPEKALKTALLQYRHACKIKNPRLLIFSVNNLGSIYFRINELKKAEFYFNKLFKQANKMKNYRYLIISCYNLALMNYRQKPDCAIKFLKTAIHTSRIRNIFQYTADCYYLLAVIYRTDQKNKPAAEFLLKAKSFAEKFKRQDLINLITDFYKSS